LRARSQPLCDLSIACPSGQSPAIDEPEPRMLADRLPEGFRKKRLLPRTPLVGCRALAALLPRKPGGLNGLTQH
jgi:hypothetical protein